MVRAQRDPIQAPNFALRHPLYSVNIILIEYRTIVFIDIALQRVKTQIGKLLILSGGDLPKGVADLWKRFNIMVGLHPLSDSKLRVIVWES